MRRTRERLLAWAREAPQSGLLLDLLSRQRPWSLKQARCAVPLGHSVWVGLHAASYGGWARFQTSARLHSAARPGLRRVLPGRLNSSELGFQVPFSLVSQVWITTDTPG